MEVVGIEVFGISLDSVNDQKRFHTEQELNFPLLPEPDGSAARKFGVLTKDGRWASRVTFIIDDKGVLRAIDKSVKVNTHGEDVILRVEELRG